MNRFINAASGPKAVGPYSTAAETDNGFLFLSGQIPLDPASGNIKGVTVAEQTATILTNISGILSELGYQKSDIIKCVIYTTDLSQFPELNQVYESFFGGHKPVRSTVGVSALPKGALVEIEATGRKN